MKKEEEAKSQGCRKFLEQGEIAPGASRENTAWWYLKFILVSLFWAFAFQEILPGSLQCFKTGFMLICHSSLRKQLTASFTKGSRQRRSWGCCHHLAYMHHIGTNLRVSSLGLYPKYRPFLFLPLSSFLHPASILDYGDTRKWISLFCLLPVLSHGLSTLHIFNVGNGICHLPSNSYTEAFPFCTSIFRNKVLQRSNWG